ncbi:MAG: nuclear transport factor 2 family protein [Acidimicrobiia bacterium]
MSDEAAVRRTIEQYFHGIDTRDFALAGACFTAGATFAQHGGTLVVEGRDQIQARFAQALAAYAHSTHTPASHRIVVDGDTARAVTLATAVLAPDTAGGAGGTILVRGLEYRDDLVRTTEGWQFARREHRVHWQHETPALPTTVLG